MKKKLLDKANKLNKQIDDLTTILRPDKIRSLSFYEDTTAEEKKAKKDGKTYYDFGCSMNLWDKDIINELFKLMQPYAEKRFKEVTQELAEL